MSHENVEAVKRSNALFNSGDHDGALADSHPDVEWRDLEHAPDAPESVRGVAVEEYIDAGDRVVCVTHWRAKGKGSGLAVDLHGAEVYEFEDGKVIRATLGYPDKAAALEAVGRRE